jgi:hypothetical protein
MGTPTPRADGPLLIQPWGQDRGTRELAIGIIGSHIVLTLPAACRPACGVSCMQGEGACDLYALHAKYERDPFSYICAHIVVIA